MANKQDLSVNELMLLNSELRDNQKSLAIAYLMLLGGHLGVHRFYLKKTATGIVQLILFLVTMISYFVSSILLFPGIVSNGEYIYILVLILFVFLPGLILFIWIIIDLFLINKMIKEWNDQVERDTIEEIIKLREQHTT